MTAEETQNSPDSKRTIRLLTEVVLPNLTLLGIGAFFVARTYYNIFFGSLGIDPSSVGLDYITTLVSSMGLLASVAVVGVVYPVAILLVWCVVTHLWRNRNSALRDLARSTMDRLRSWLPRALRVSIPIAISVALAILATFFWMRAGNYARAVESGRPVKLGSLILTTFGVRASPVDLALAPGEDGNEGIKQMIMKASQTDGKILYLGQGDGHAVLYDATSHRAIYLPTEKLILHVANCEDPPAVDVRCEAAVS